MIDPELREAAEALLRDPARPNNQVTIGKSESREAGSLITRRLSEIDAKVVNWLWPGRIARGKISIIAGNPGLGKSQVTASMAGIISTGGYWPVDHCQCVRGDVIFLSAEDDPADTIRPRLEAAGANLDRVHIMEAVISGSTSEGKQVSRAFSLTRDIDALGLKLRELGDVAAVVIDPIAAYLGEVDSHRNSDVRALLAPLSDLAAQHQVAIIGVSHLNKSAGSEPLMRVQGSLAFVATSRAAFLVAQDPENKARRLFLPMKNNIGPDSNGLAFSIETVEVEADTGTLRTSRVSWEPEAVRVSADDVMKPQDPERTSALREAEEFLTELLDDMAAPFVEVERKAKEVGISKNTLRRAATSLHVLKEKRGMKAGWYWSLPAKMPNKPEDAQETGMGTFGNHGHLREADRPSWALQPSSLAEVSTE